MQEALFGFSREPFSFAMPKMVMGWGALNKLAEIAVKWRLKRVAVITDQGIVDVGIAGRAASLLKEVGVEVLCFDEVEPEPSVATTQRAAEFLQECRPDSVLGLGGGSCLDVAKAASMAAAHNVQIADCLGMDRAPGKGLRTILAPTTSGTGSEVTSISVLTDLEDGGAKKVMYSDALLADVALIDPELTVGLPAKMTAASGIDALTHAVEGYVSVRRNPVSDMFSERAIRLIGTHLRTAVLKGRHSPEARYFMSMAATMAGLSFVNSSVGAVHAVSLPFGVKYEVGHGESNAVVFPHVIEYCVPADPKRFANIARWLGVTDRGEDDLELAFKGVEAIWHLVEDCGINPRLSAYGVTKDDFDGFVDMIMAVQYHNLERSPRDLGREDLLAIYEAAL